MCVHQYYPVQEPKLTERVISTYLTVMVVKVWLIVSGIYM